MRPRVAAIAAVLLLAACGGSSGTGPEVSASPTGDPNLWRSDPSEPFPFTEPVPPRSPTPVDGTYFRNVESGTVPIPCRRCAPYRVDRGPATLRLESGRYYVDQPRSRFVASGHFVIDGDRLTLFNDANCPTTSGSYTWSLEEGRLVLEAVEDDCAFDLLRARYFSAAPWLAGEGA